MSPTSRKSDIPRETTLYRLYDAAGVLLYIGIATNLGRRLEQHQASQPWWSEFATIERIVYPTWAEAKQAEREAIKEEAPRYNQVHTRDLRQYAQAIQVWCAACNQPVQADSGYLTVNMRDVQDLDDWERAHEKPGGLTFYTGADLLNMPKGGIWRGYHRDCDPLPDGFDYWLDAGEFQTWRDVIETTAHLMGKTWLHHTDWDDVLIGILTGKGPLRSP